ncbi:FK506-binding protein 4-like isoform X3 [Rhodamnia argentea]|uniref:FK506-binding protein 4-like isoform X3 n=1 Tax=Rhodamnia argentea TaxID=178133 RepID=A0A8B8QUY7_9MYRT|nr:FK506-binding protein 4-like isoform X3 [Rhodamnia argentea]
MMKKRCELCDQRAAMHCESDQASLCWSCDEKVHGANFLVAKHARALLCHVCQSPTPWKASGPKLGPTVSVCECCRRICEEKVETGARGDVGGDGCSLSGGYEEAEDYDDNDVNEMLDDDEHDDEGEDEEEEEEVDDEEEEEEEGEDGENQVVPWSCDSPPPAASSSTEEESTSRTIAVASGGLLAETIASGGLRMKRPRQSEDLDSDDEIGCVSSGLNSRTLDKEEATSSSALLRPTKQRRAVEASPIATSGGRVGAESLMTALKRLNAATVGNAAATVSSICRLSGYHQSR